MGWSKYTLSRFLSFVHALVVTGFGIYILMHATPDMFLDPFNVFDVCRSSQDFETAQIWGLMFQVTYVYLACDLALMLLMPSPGDLTWILHHAVGGLGIYLIHRDRVLWSLGLFFELTEVTTIFLNICWFLLHNNLRRSVLFMWSALLLVTLFFLVRIVGGIAICIMTGLQLQEYGSEFLLYQQVYATVAPILILGLSIYWFKLLLDKM